MEKLCREENGGCKRDHRSDNWAPPELEFCSNIWAAGKGWLFDRSAEYWLLHMCTESYLWLSIGLVEVLLVGVFISIFVFHRVFVFVFVLLGLCRCIVVKIGAGGVWGQEKADTGLSTNINKDIRYQRTATIKWHISFTSFAAELVTKWKASPHFKTKIWGPGFRNSSILVNFANEA